MNNTNGSQSLLDSVVKLMTSEMLNSNFDNALDCAIFARLLSRNDSNPNPTQAALTCIRECASELTGNPTTTFHGAGVPAKCSFCGQEPPSVKLGAGPGVFICDECVSAFAKNLGASVKP